MEESSNSQIFVVMHFGLTLCWRILASRFLARRVFLSLLSRISSLVSSKSNIGILIRSRCDDVDSEIIVTSFLVGGVLLGERYSGEVLNMVESFGIVDIFGGRCHPFVLILAGFLAGIFIWKDS